ncbi:ferrochelatase [Herpetosiphon giganteus]|uniref:ferrochelatase n=1 Tax=Herpetosiphon giganteus TaxID=2029754 RepID=UPI00195C7925|nr:ferrochelatase [Herpetosiphon giganteus]MBM7843093.1 ferrochelatase [Herpetosiphon giganteus]
MSAKTAVLLMAYGTPNAIDEVEQYYINVRGGRMPTPEQVENLSARYRAVGGHTPLTTLTKSVTDQLQVQLDAEFPDQYQVYFGMKYWHPLIPDVVKQINADGISKVVGLALAPHYSKISIGGYQKQVDRANEEFNTNIELQMINSWQEQPKFRNLIASRISEALSLFPAEVRDQVTVLFSAHSLPQRVLAWGDPYPEELLGSAKGIAEMLELHDWRFTYQSQGETGEPWLGPDVLDTLAELAAEGKKYVLQVPFGFVCDHLEILYDIDIEGKHKANELGLQLERIRLLNDDPAFVDLLKTVVTGQ